MGKIGLECILGFVGCEVEYITNIFPDLPVISDDPPGSGRTRKTRPAFGGFRHNRFYKRSYKFSFSAVLFKDAPVRCPALSQRRGGGDGGGRLIFSPPSFSR